MARDVALRVAKLKARQDLAKQILAGSGRALDGLKDVAIAALGNPIITMIAGAVLIEYLQRVQVNSGRYGMVPQDPSAAPGYTTHVWGPIKTPILSEQLGSTLEGVIITNGAMQALGGIGGITSLIGSFLK